MYRGSGLVFCMNRVNQLKQQANATLWWLFEKLTDPCYVEMPGKIFLVWVTYKFLESGINFI